MGTSPGTKPEEDAKVRCHASRYLLVLCDRVLSCLHYLGSGLELSASIRWAAMSGRGTLTGDDARVYLLSGWHQ